MKSWGSQPQGFFQILLQDSFQLEASAEDPSGIDHDRFFSSLFNLLLLCLPPLYFNDMVHTP